MTHRKVKNIRVTTYPKSLMDNWIESTKSGDVEVDETDLIMFRLLGVEFKYSEVEFMED